MNLKLKPMTVEQAHRFLHETLLKATYYCEITEEAAIARIEFFWDCLKESIITNYEDWNGLQLKDFQYIENKAVELKTRFVDKKLTALKVDTASNYTVVDGVEITAENVNLDRKTEVLYQGKQKVRKTLTIEWFEPYALNPVHTVAPPLVLSITPPP